MRMCVWKYKSSSKAVDGTVLACRIVGAQRFRRNVKGKAQARVHTQLMIK